MFWSIFCLSSACFLSHLLALESQTVEFQSCNSLGLQGSAFCHIYGSAFFLSLFCQFSVCPYVCLYVCPISFGVPDSRLQSASVWDSKGLHSFLLPVSCLSLYLFACLSRIRVENLSFYQTTVQVQLSTDQVRILQSFKEMTNT